MTEKKSKKSVGAAMGRSAAYMKSSVVFVLPALLFAVASAVITIIGPDKVGEIATIMSDGLFGKIDLAAIAKIGVTLALLYCLSAAARCSPFWRLFSKLRNFLSFRLL